MANNLPKRPIRFQEENSELLKSMDDYGSAKGRTDYVNDTDVVSVGPGVQSSYRTPDGRVSGNSLFRRYLNGSLDLEDACNKVIDAIHRVKENAAPLNSLEVVALSCLFPGQFDGVDPALASSVASVQFNLLPQECELIRQKVSSHLAEELNWNSGQGGGSVPGRSQTKS